MFKAVFDSTVLVSALLTPKGLSRGLIDRAKLGEFELFLSEEILKEARKTLVTRKRLRELYRYTDEEVAYFLSGVRRIASLVTDLPSIQVVRDPKDDVIVATAVKAGANYLVARDNDLLVLSSYQSIQIVTPETFSSILREMSTNQPQG